MFKSRPLTNPKCNEYQTKVDEIREQIIELQRQKTTLLIAWERIQANCLHTEETHKKHWTCSICGYDPLV